MNLPARYTEKQLERARNRERLVGWAQGAGAVVAAAVLWNLLGWIPVLLVLLAVGWVVVKLVSGSDDDGEGAPQGPEV
jgi:hypothetical protein